MCPVVEPLFDYSRSVEALRIGDPRRGWHVNVLFAGWRQDAKPSRMADDEGRQWVVEQIVGHWEHPNRGVSGAGKVPYGIEVERWRLLVVGPLPYRRGRGEQHVAIRSFFSALCQPARAVAASWTRHGVVRAVQLTM
jgi:hypothetical protein